MSNWDLLIPTEYFETRYLKYMSDHTYFKP